MLNLENDNLLYGTVVQQKSTPTSFFFIECISKLCCEITGNSFVLITKMKKKKDVGMDLFV